MLVLALVGKKIYAYQAAYHSCFENISNNRFKALAETSDAVIVLDVRTAQEYRQGNIKNALNMDVSESDFESKVSPFEASKTILVYCRSGSRSIKAAQILCEKGFKNVYNLTNGYMGWKE